MVSRSLSLFSFSLSFPGPTVSSLSCLPVPSFHIPPQALTAEYMEGLRQRMHGKVLLPHEGPAFREAARCWNLAADSRPAAIIRCAGAADVVEAVGAARNMQLGLTVAGGRCSNVCQKNGVLCLDLALMRAVFVDPARQTVRVQGGARVRDVMMECGLYGLQTPLPAALDVGVSVALRGGFGFLSKLCGMTLDNVLSLELVTAAGKVVRCSPHHEPELFWAMRGAGPNFGVVTLIELQCYPVGRVRGGLLLVPGDAAMSCNILNIMRDTYEDPEFYMMAFSSGPGKDFAALGVACAHFGGKSVEETEAALQDRVGTLPLAGSSVQWQSFTQLNVRAKPRVRGEGGGAGAE